LSHLIRTQILQHSKILRLGLIAFLLFCFAFVLRLPGLFWGYHYISGGPLMFIASDETSFVKHFLPLMQNGTIGRQDYFFGFAREAQLAMQLFIHQDEPITSELILMVVRMMNIVFASATVVVVFLLASALFGNTIQAILAALVFSLLPLHVLQSHYATPAASFVFWFWSAIYSFFVFSKKNSIWLWYFAWACAACACATKFGFVVLIPGFILFARRPTLALGLGLILFVVVFLYMNLWWAPWDLYEGLKNSTVPDNFNERVYSRWTNIVTYIIGLMPALTLAVLIPAFFGLWQRLRSISSNILSQVPKDFFYILELPLLVQFLILLSLTSAFNRHLVIFMPYFAILAVTTLCNMAKRTVFQRSVALVSIISIVFYQLTAVVNLESNLLPNRYLLALKWLAQNKPATDTIYFPSKWEFEETLRPVVPSAWRSDSVETAKYALVPDKVIWRMKRSTLNPFTERPKYNEIFHSGMIDDYATMLKIVFEESQFEKVVNFSSVEYLPEFILYKKLFSTYTDEYGDITIYKRK